MQTEMVIHELPAATPAPSPGALVHLALTNGADPGTLERLLDLQQRWEAGEARKAYTRAMAAFKRTAPAVLAKDGRVKHPGADYRHATLGSVVMQITSHLSANGLSVAWETEQGEGYVGVTCRVTHEHGHSEAVKLMAPPDTSGKKNPIQEIGSTVTYLQRYTLLAALGLATADQDDDGRAAYIVREEVGPGPAPKPGPAPRAQHTEVRSATPAQRDLAGKLVETHVITPAETARLLAKAADPRWTLDEATKAIEWIQDKTKERKAVELLDAKLRLDAYSRDPRLEPVLLDRVVGAIKRDYKTVKPLAPLLAELVQSLGDPQPQADPGEPPEFDPETGEVLDNEWPGDRGDPCEPPDDEREPGQDG